MNDHIIDPPDFEPVGLHARGGKLVVGCPEGFWRKGNVEVVCTRFGVPLVGDWDAFVAAVARAIGAAQAAGRS
jgi:hypothetical protein